MAFALSEESVEDDQAMHRFSDVLSDLSQHGCRIVLFVQKCEGTRQPVEILSPLFMDLASSRVTCHQSGERASLPHPLWQTGSPIIPIEIETDSAAFFFDEVVRLLVAWRIKRLVWIQDPEKHVKIEGALPSFVGYNRLLQWLDPAGQGMSGIDPQTGAHIQHLLDHGVHAISLCRLQDLSRELFTYAGCGLFFSQSHYCQVRDLNIDDFPQVASLIRQGESEGYLLSRSDQEMSEILLAGFGAFLSGNHVAGVCCLLTDEYRDDQAAEIVALYALTRFQGEGIGEQLIQHGIATARARKARYLFSCTTRQQVVQFFERNGFVVVSQDQIPEEKWRHYDKERRDSVVCLRLALEAE